MVKASFVTLSLLLTTSGAVAESSFHVQPQACISTAKESCRVDLVVSWNSATPLCLSQQKTGGALICGTTINNYTVTLTMNNNLILELREHHSKALVASKTIKYLQQSEITNVSPRRLSWSIF